MIKDILPNKASHLIRLAVHDTRNIKEDDRYQLNLACLHIPGNLMRPARDKCQVCIAGSVISKTLNFPIDKCINEEDFEPSAFQKIMAIDCLRCFRVSTGVALVEDNTPRCRPDLAEKCLPIEKDFEVFHLSDTDNKPGSEEHLKLMLKMADALENVGL